MNATKNETTPDFLRRTGTCYEGSKWALRTSGAMAGVWDACTRFDWLVWMLKNLKEPVDEHTRLAIRYAALRIVRETPLHDGRRLWDVLNAPTRAAFCTALRYLDGMATIEELAAANATFAERAEGDAADMAIYASAYADAYADAARVRKSPAARAFHVRTLKEAVPNPFLP